jgi:hypothetical protein
MKDRHLSASSSKFDFPRLNCTKKRKDKHKKKTRKKGNTTPIKENPALNCSIGATHSLPHIGPEKGTQQPDNKERCKRRPWIDRDSRHKYFVDRIITFPKTNHLSIFTLNARGIVARKEELQQFITLNSFDIACIQETWMTPKTRIPKFIGYNLLHTDPSKVKGSGVAILMNKNIVLNNIIVYNLNDGLEYIKVDFNNDDGKALRLINVYIHPYAKGEVFHELEDLINEHTILVGDLNAHNILWSLGNPNKRGSDVIDFMNTNNLRVINNKLSPTWSSINKRSGSPDMIIVSKNIKNKDIKDWKVGPDLGSDHLPIRIEIESKVSRCSPHRHLHWIFSKLDEIKYKNTLNNKLLDISSENYNCQEINTIYERLQKTTVLAAKECCPRSAFSNSKHGTPWWNDECTKSVNTKRRLRKESMIHQTDYKIGLFKAASKKSRKVIYIAKKEFWERLYNRANINDLFKYFRRINNSRDNIYGVNINNQTIYDNKIIGNGICKFFSNCGNNNKFRFISLCKNHSNHNLDDSLLNDDISELEVKNVINNLNLKKASGPDEIAPFMVVKGGEVYIKALTVFFNLVWDEGKSPEEWHNSTIIPIPKSRKKFPDVDDFRPISLTSVVGKLFESIMLRRLKLLSEEHKWLPKFQKGFRKGCSTLDNLVYIQQEIHKTYKNKEVMLAVFLDIKKAYDCVNRRILYNMIKKLGIYGKMDKWLKNFLTMPRYGRVNFNGSKSKKFKFENGVPQGSPLSPILFNIYVSKVGVSGNKNISQFADDLMIWETDLDINVAAKKLNKRLEILNKWACRINLEFSPHKCSVVKFTRKRINLETPDIYLAGNKLQYKNEAKYLGVIFDQRTTWKNHIKNIVNKSSKRQGILKFMARQNNGVSQEYLLTMYKSLIRPVLEYASEIWGDASTSNKVKLDSIQHRSITSALGVNRLAHRKDTNYEARILPLDFRRKEKLFKFWKRLKDNSDTKEYISKLKRPDRLINDRRKSFFERILALKKEYKESNIDIDKIDFKIFHRQTVSKWIQSLRNSKTEEDREKGMSYKDLRTLKYRRFSKDRKENAAWHQARLGVLPLKAFLFEINKAKNNICRRCKTKETV